MRTKLLPIIWWSAGLLAAAAIAAPAIAARWNPFLVFVLVWLGTIFAGLSAGSLALRIKPELRFSTRRQEDGMGYLHEPAGFVITVTIICAMGAAFFFVVRSIVRT